MMRHQGGPENLLPYLSPIPVLLRKITIISDQMTHRLQSSQINLYQNYDHLESKKRIRFNSSSSIRSYSNDSQSISDI